MSMTTGHPAPALDPGRHFEAVSAGGSVADAPPVCLYLEVTNRCNLLCETCPRTFEALEPPMNLSLFSARGCETCTLGDATQQAPREIWNSPAYRGFRAGLVGDAPPKPCQGCGPRWSL